MSKKGLLILSTLFLSSQSLVAQDGGNDFMRSMGKMYVVVAVIIVVFVGLIAFLVYLDRRLTKIEDQISENE